MKYKAVTAPDIATRTSIAIILDEMANQETISYDLVSNTFVLPVFVFSKLEPKLQSEGLEFTVIYTKPFSELNPEIQAKLRHKVN